MPSPSMSATEAAAYRCVDAIMLFWAKRGHKVHAWIKPQTKFVEGRGSNKGVWVTALYAVHSDLVNGMPVKKARAA